MSDTILLMTSLYYVISVHTHIVPPVGLGGGQKFMEVLKNRMFLMALINFFIMIICVWLDLKDIMAFVILLNCIALVNGWTAVDQSVFKNTKDSNERKKEQ